MRNIPPLRAPVLILAAWAAACAPHARAASNYETPYTFRTVAGLAGIPGQFNGQGTIALFDGPTGIAVDGSGNVYVADTDNGTVRRITATGAVTTFAGSPGVVGSRDGVGTTALFGTLIGMAVDGAGNVYVSDNQFNTVRKITPAGVVTTLAGSAGVTGHADGTGTAAQFNRPTGIGVDGNGNVYVADSANDTIRKISPSGVVSTLAGTPGVLGTANGTGASASFNAPDGLTSDPAGNVYVADDSDTIRRISPAGVVTPFVGIAGTPGSADGTGSGATFNQPAGMAIDPIGNLYVVDAFNDTVRMITPAGLVTTLAGRVGTAGSADGTGVSALFNQPVGIAVDGNGNLFVADTNNSTIREGTVAAPNSAPPRLINISTRAQVGTGGNILIPGFVVGGSGMETLLIRGVGPSLGEFNVTGILSVPVLTVFNSAGAIIASNKGWDNSADPGQLAAAATAVGAFPLANNSTDCALIISVPPGSYTAQISSGDGTTGVALAEIYEMATTGTRLVNLSTRAQVGSGANIVIPGFVIAGGGKENLLLRADGPSLAQFNVPGFLAQPVLLLVDPSGQALIGDTGWSTNLNADDIASEAAKVGAFSLPAGSADSATLTSLTPGPYTIEIFGVNNTTGVGLAEIYEVP